MERRGEQATKPSLHLGFSPFHLAFSPLGRGLNAATILRLPRRGCDKVLQLDDWSAFGRSDASDLTDWRPAARVGGLFRGRRRRSLKTQQRVNVENLLPSHRWEAYRVVSSGLRLGRYVF